MGIKLHMGGYAFSPSVPLHGDILSFQEQASRVLKQMAGDGSAIYELYELFAFCTVAFLSAK